jgi:hypothetical protein
MPGIVPGYYDPFDENFFVGRIEQKIAELNMWIAKCSEAKARCDPANRRYLDKLTENIMYAERAVARLQN